MKKKERNRMVRYNSHHARAEFQRLSTLRLLRIDTELPRSVFDNIRDDNDDGVCRTNSEKEISATHPGQTSLAALSLCSLCTGVAGVVKDVGLAAGLTWR